MQISGGKEEGDGVIVHADILENQKCSVSWFQYDEALKEYIVVAIQSIANQGTEFNNMSGNWTSMVT